VCRMTRHKLRLFERSSPQDRTDRKEKVKADEMQTSRGIQRKSSPEFKLNVGSMHPLPVSKMNGNQRRSMSKACISAQDPVWPEYVPQRSTSNFV
jgi:hypothetical protein